MFSSNTVLLSVFTQTLEIWNTPIGNFSGQRSQDNLKKKKKKIQFMRRKKIFIISLLCSRRLSCT